MAENTPVAAYEVSGAGGSGLPKASQRQAVWSLRPLAGVLVPSRFNVSVDLPDGRKAVYNTFSAALAVLKAEHWRRYFPPAVRHEIQPDAMPKMLEKLHARGFLVNAEIDEMELVRQYYQRDRYDPRSSLSVNLLPTMGCNLVCPYCFQGQTQMTAAPRMMSRETEEAVFHYLQNRMGGRRGLAMSWFGGEPLLGLRLIDRLGQRLIASCDQAGLEYRAVLTTNAVLLDRDAVDILVAGRVALVQVSIDIPGETKHDKKGRDTLDTVLDNLALATEKVHIQLRINMTRDDEAEWLRLTDGLVKRGLQNKLQAYIANVVQPELARRDGVGSTVSHRDYVDVLVRQRRRAKEIGLRSDGPVPSSCASGCAATSGSALTIDPDGLLYKCPDDAGRPDRAYGTVFLEQVMRTDNLLPWLGYDWFRHEECWNCAMLPQCAGGCPHRRRFQSELPNDDHCYWFLRGDLEARVRDTAIGLLSDQGPGGMEQACLS